MLIIVDSAYRTYYKHMLGPIQIFGDKVWIELTAKYSFKENCIVLQKFKFVSFKKIDKIFCRNKFHKLYTPKKEFSRKKANIGLFYLKSSGSDINT